MENQHSSRPANSRTFPLQWSALLSREFWITFFTYLLFAASTFTVSGVELSVMFLYLLTAYHFLRGPVPMGIPKWLAAPFILWILVAVGSALANPEPAATLLSLRHQYRILLPFALLLALRHVELERLLKVYLAFACVAAVYALFQTAFAVDLMRPQGRIIFDEVAGFGINGVIYRARGNFAGTNAFGFLMMATSLMFAGLAGARLPRGRRTWLFGALLTAGGLLASISRAAWLGALVGLLVLAMRLPRRWAAAIASAALALAILAIIVMNSNWVEEELRFLAQIPLIGRLAGMHISNDSAQVRFVLWDASIRGIKEKPLLGAGFMNRGAMLKNLRPPERLRAIFPIRASGDDAHNIFLQVTYYFGLLGLGAFLSMWAAVIAWNLRCIKIANGRFPLETGVLWGSSAVFAAALIDGLFHDNFFGAVANFTIMICMGLSFFAGLRIHEQIASHRSAG
ncbi:MAG: O-antigen ligase family protein [SAR324 cluster bacterium]|nr:O-antigen ligase family protein [SAR324 cluster bacterium]